MVPVVSLLLILLLSLLVTRVASSALVHTGLSREAARFQARSAFTGAGFTTEEAEMVVNHPVRRRVVMLLMLLGNAGLVTAITSLILTFLEPSGVSGYLRAGFLITGLALLAWLANSRRVERWLSGIIDRALARMTDLDVQDYASLLHLTDEYRLVEFSVPGGGWLDGKSLKETRLRQEGLVVLGIHRDGGYIGTPTPDRTFCGGDVLVLYGHRDALVRLNERPGGPEGDEEHHEAVVEQSERLREQAQTPPEGDKRGAGSAGRGDD